MPMSTLSTGSRSNRRRGGDIVQQFAAIRSTQLGGLACYHFCELLSVHPTQSHADRSASCLCVVAVTSPGATPVSMRYAVANSLAGGAYAIRSTDTT